jgi:hypothetical protein
MEDMHAVETTLESHHRQLAASALENVKVVKGQQYVPKSKFTELSQVVDWQMTLIRALSTFVSSDIKSFEESLRKGSF